MATQAPASEVKRAKAQLNVYTGLLVVALLMAALGSVSVALSNMDATGQGPFDVTPAR